MCHRARLRAAFGLALVGVACARTGLNPGDLEGELGSSDPSTGGAGALLRGGASAGLATAGYGGNAGGGAAGASGVGGVAGSREPPEPMKCQPSPEVCNGRDDDCNGRIDDLPAEPCPGGGARVCVAGRLSQCPQRCEVCVPGSVRICQNSFCSYWGQQECAGDGQGFGHCREQQPPPECSQVAAKHHDSKQLEQCCLDNGYCCLDEHDLDGDGDRGEMLGVCGDVVCR